LLTGIGSCFFDSTPAVFITGQVNRYEMKGQRAIRQLGFQETDIVAMAAPVTKAAWRAHSPEQVPELLAQAFTLALAGRPGPVLLDLPMDVQNATIPVPPDQPDLSAQADGAACDPALVEALLRALCQAERPMILAGGGIRSARATAKMREFVAMVKAPVTTSLMGLDCLPSADPYRVGMIGTYGNRWANQALAHSDFLLVLGSRLDVRQTGSNVTAFQQGRTIYQVDCDEAETNNRVTGCHVIVSSLGSFFEAGLHQAAGMNFPERPEWLRAIAEWKRASPDTAELQGVPGVNPNELMHQLSRASAAKDVSAFVADVGQHQMWAAQSLELGAQQRFLTSGGMGAMGSGLPLGIGAALACPGQPVVLIAGDGGFQLNIQELQTVVRNRLPLKIVIVNNQCHGLVRQFQESYFDRRYPATLLGYSAPDFTQIAKAYGIASMTVEAPGDVASAIEWLYRDPAEACLLDVQVHPFANTYPKIAFGRPITEMEPQAKPLDIEST
jgi:acetolactate synthase-1/2/3 large subunit